MEMENTLFRDAVTSTAFNLSLSRNMIAMLCETAAWEPFWEAGGTPKKARYHFDGAEAHAITRLVAMGGRNDFTTGIRGIVSRGLAYAPDKRWPGILRLTDAGKHVVELLKIAGLAVEFTAVNLPEAV
jgi:hypothetical protein